MPGHGGRQTLLRQFSPDPQSDVLLQDVHIVGLLVTGQSLSVPLFSPSGQQPSPLRAVSIGSFEHVASHRDAEPEYMSSVQSSRSLQAAIVGQLPSHSSPSSTTSLPQTASQVDFSGHRILLHRNAATSEKRERATYLDGPGSCTQHADARALLQMASSSRLRARRVRGSASIGLRREGSVEVAREEAGRFRGGQGSFGGCASSGLERSGAG